MTAVLDVTANKHTGYGAQDQSYRIAMRYEQNAGCQRGSGEIASSLRSSR